MTRITTVTDYYGQERHIESSTATAQLSPVQQMVVNEKISELFRIMKATHPEASALNLDFCEISLENRTVILIDGTTLNSERIQEKITEIDDEINDRSGSYSISTKSTRHAPSKTATKSPLKQTQTAEKEQDEESDTPWDYAKYLAIPAALGVLFTPRVEPGAPLLLNPFNPFGSAAQGEAGQVASLSAAGLFKAALPIAGIAAEAYAISRLKNLFTKKTATPIPTAPAIYQPAIKTALGVPNMEPASSTKRDIVALKEESRKKQSKSWFLRYFSPSPRLSSQTQVASGQSYLSSSQPSYTRDGRARSSYSQRTQEREIRHVTPRSSSNMSSSWLSSLFSGEKSKEKEIAALTTPEASPSYPLEVDLGVSPALRASL